MDKPLRLRKAQLDRLVEEATVDAYGEGEQATSFLYTVEEYLSLPFETEVLGLSVKVEKLDLTGRYDIIAVCRRGKEKQRIPILDLNVPDPPPEGWEWVEAFRHWAKGWE